MKDEGKITTKTDIWKNLKLIAWFNFFVDFRLASVVLVLYFQKMTGSFVAAMSLYSITSISSALAEVPTGIFSDLMGRKKTMITGCVFVLVAFILYALGINFWILALGALIEGIGLSWFSGNNEALLHDSLKESGDGDYFDEYLGKTSSMFQLAAVFATLLGGVLASISYPILMWLSVLPMLVALFVSLKIREPKKLSEAETNVFAHIKEAIGLLWKNKRLRLVTLAEVIGEGISEPSYQFRSAFVASVWPLWAIGIGKTLSSLGATVSFWISGKVLKKIKPEKFLFAEMVVSKIVTISGLLMNNIFSPILMSTTSLWYGISMVASKKIMHEEYSDNQRATMSSLKSLLGSISMGIYSIFLGLFADKWSPTTALLISQLLSIPSMVMKWNLRKYAK